MPMAEEGAYNSARGNRRWSLLWGRATLRAGHRILVQSFGVSVEDGRGYSRVFISVVVRASQLVEAGSGRERRRSAHCWVLSNRASIVASSFPSGQRWVPRER